MIRRKNHKCQSVPVVILIQIDTTPSINPRASNSESTKMELALELDLSCKRHTESEHNRKQERVDIEEASQELHHHAQLQSKDK